MIEILMIDQDTKFFNQLSLMLEDTEYRLHYFQTYDEAKNDLSNTKVKLVIIEIKKSTEHSCQKISRNYNIPILILATNDHHNILIGLKLGADDYIIKPFSKEELITRISISITRNLERRIFNKNDLYIDFEKRIVKRFNKKVTLTPLEFKLLSLLVNNPQKIFTRQEIINEIYSDIKNNNERVIDSHIKNLRKKISDTTQHFIISVFGVGYRFEL